MRLVVPQSRFIKSYLQFCVEYKKSGLSDFAITGKTIPELTEILQNDSRLAAVTPAILAELDALRAPANKIQTPSSTYWLLDENGNVTAIGSVRHYISPALELFGGHIGYGVRVGHWNRGRGTEILRLLLPEAASLGIKYALLTCEIGNVPSLRVMEKNGGQMLDTAHYIINGYERMANRVLIDTGLKLNRRSFTINPVAFNQSIGSFDLCLVPVKTVDEGGIILSHYFNIVRSGTTVGWIVFRMADEPWLYYDGNIGYFVESRFRRKGHAKAACALFMQYLKSLGMGYIYITCDSDNSPSRTICRRLDAKLLEIALYNTGIKDVIKCRYLLEL